MELRRLGHDAVHALDYGLESAGDQLILERAASEDRVIVTSDTDFGELLAQSAAIKPSIVLFRRTSGKPAQESSLLLTALSYPAVNEALESGGVVVVAPWRVRIRKLPIGGSEE